MRTEVFTDETTADARRHEIQSAFGERGIAINREGPLALKSAEIFDLRIDVAFILAATLGGAMWDAEKALLRRGIDALRAVWQTSGTMTIDTDTEPRVRVPTVYFVPGGDDGNEALAASAADYETAPPGQRLWLRGIGWIDSRDLGRITDDVRALREEDHADL